MAPTSATPDEPFPATAASARDRLLDAADALFYGEGVTTVGIDRVIATAGVAKATLYHLFGSKEALIRAYLERRHLRRRERLERALARFESPRAKLLGIFEALEDIVAQPGYRGCAFVNASAEASAAEAVQTVCDQTRAWTRSLFAALAREAGARDPDALAAQLVVLYDGTLVGVRMDRTAAAAAKPARALAQLAVEAACDPGRRG